VYRVQIPLARVVPVEGGTWSAVNDPYLVDRALAALTLLLTATILQGWLLSLRTIELRDRVIEENNQRLARANAELTRRQAEITVKNNELERRRQELERISKRKTQMLASISHDIRGPLQSISVMAEIMLRSAHTQAPGSRIPVYAQRLQAHALSVAELLSEVMDTASFDTGEVSLHRSRFELRELLAEQAQRLAPLAEVKGLRLEVVHGAETLMLETDRVKLGRVVGNLVSNAIKFTSKGSVTLASRADEDGRVFVSVTDTGCGIRPENLERVFGEFCQEDAAAIQSGSGWGLGLSICRRLAAALGGDLQVESVPGMGSTFTVVLPASRTRQETGLG
jgi:signal transduction histidine kinase